MTQEIIKGLFSRSYAGERRNLFAELDFFKDSVLMILGPEHRVTTLMKQAMELGDIFSLRFTLAVIRDLPENVFMNIQEHANGYYNWD